MMKIAVSGKGGVGKSTIAAGIALTIARRGGSVLAVDADPDANLADALGIPRAAQGSIVTIARHRELVEERTGAKAGEYGQIFKLNPTVSDIADDYAYAHRGVSLLVLGAVKGGGAGCACPESSLLRALVQDLVLRRDETLVMDMEAGIEHLGRATVRGVTALVVVVEPGMRSVETVKRIAAMAAEIGLARIAVVVNKVRSDDDERYLRESLPGLDIAASFPFSDRLLASDRDGVAVIDGMDDGMRARLEALVDFLEGKYS